MNHIPCRLIHGFQQAGVAQAGIGKLSEAELRDTLTRCGIRHASAYGAQAAFCAVTAKAALEAMVVDPSRVGLISNGGPWSADAALAFLRSIDERGHQFVNPLTLPATLVSAAPTATAAVVGAKAFAFAAGFDELAFFEVLMRARQLMRHDMASHVVALACCARSEALHGALEILGQSTPILDCAMGMLLGPVGVQEEKCFASGFMLAGAIVGVDDHPWPAVERRYAGLVSKDGLIDFPLDQSLSIGRTFSASGAVLCQAAMHAVACAETQRREFVVSCRKGDVTGAALFEWLP